MSWFHFIGKCISTLFYYCTTGFLWIWDKCCWKWRVVLVVICIFCFSYLIHKIVKFFKRHNDPYQTYPLPKKLSFDTISQYFLYTFLRRHPSSVLYDSSSLLWPSISETSNPRNTINSISSATSAFSDIKSSSKESRGEMVCKQVAEEYFQLPFRKTRPAFLKNPITGDCLELDVYNDELRLGIEYHGSQHYFYNNFYHQKSKDKFQNQQYRDFIKRDLCRQHKVHLIVVPFSLVLEDIKPFLLREFERFQHIRHVYIPEDHV